MEEMCGDAGQVDLEVKGKSHQRLAHFCGDAHTNGTGERLLKRRVDRCCGVRERFVYSAWYKYASSGGVLSTSRLVAAFAAAPAATTRPSPKFRLALLRRGVLMGTTALCGCGCLDAATLAAHWTGLGAGGAI